MCMSNIERGCRELFSRCVRLRDKCCQVCGHTNPECHHLILLSQGNWEIQFDLDFAIALCAEHHRGRPDSPHVSPELFRVRMLEQLYSTMDADRAAKIQKLLIDGPGRAMHKPDFKTIRNRLKEHIRELEDDYYCDADINQMDMRKRRHYG